MAARAGLKAMGKNAFFGALVLAAIEGANIALQRLLLPMWMESGANAPIDLLDPPRDPSRPYRRTSPLWTPSSSSSSNSLQIDVSSPVAPQPISAPQPSAGFELDSISTFDTQADSWQKKQEESEAAAKEETKPFWKVW